MSKVVQKVTAFIVRERSGVKELLVFKTTQEETADAWELKSDQGHIFKPYWTPLSPKPQIISPQDKWLDFVHERI